MFGRLHKLLLATAALLPLGLALAFANPQGPQVVGGSASVQGQGTATVTITQTTNSAIINWNTFNIGVGEKTKIFMPSSSSVQLDRVTGGLGPSQILGSLWSNGRIFLVNPDGILFGPGSRVDTAGFLATTIDIKNADFMAGRYSFSIPGRPDASIVNEGTITARNGGFAALVAPGVRNSGTITARLGTISLASGNAFTLDLYGDKLITLGISDSIAAIVKDVSTGQPLSSLVSNEGKLKANGGTVELTAVAARQVVDSVINNKGVIEANSIGTRNGMIVLSAATAASKPAGAPTQTVKIAGTLSAAGKKNGEKGGTIEVTGESIALTGAALDASGRSGGGTVLIGGDWSGGHPALGLVSNASATLERFAVPTATTTVVDAASSIDASAIAAGNGGKVIVWADGATTFAGGIAARGGGASGNGGFVEVSGHQTLNFYGTVDTSAPKGLFGTLLLDPFNVTITSSATFNGTLTSGVFTPSGDNSLLNASALTTALGSSNVVVTTGVSGSQPGDITVAAPVTWLSTNTLTLSAAHDIAINAAITAATGGLVVNAVNGVTASGAINVARFELAHGAWSQIGTLPSFAATQDFKIDTGASFLRVAGGDGLAPASAYQITDVYGLQGIGSSTTLLSKFYTLPNPTIDATVTATWNSGAGFSPIGNFPTGFTGQLDGQNNTIDKLSIAPATALLTNVGLFGYIGTGAVVKNLNLTNVDIHANTGLGPGASQNMGALAGTNAGTINNVQVSSGTVDGGTVNNVFAGGLVGQNGFFSNPSFTPGTILNSSAPGPTPVTVTSGGVNVTIGGLVGSNSPGSTITTSFAAAPVSATASLTANIGMDCSIPGNCQYESAGGLVGQNSGTILGAAVVPTTSTSCAAGQACASGAVSVGSDGQGGGLVGFNDGIITNAFATGAVTGTAGFPRTGNHDHTTSLGGLAGTNVGLIEGSHATGTVGTPGVDYLQVGGLVADNSGKIDNSFATGAVRAGDNSFAGGLVSDNGINFSCSGCFDGDGHAYFNTGVIIDSQAFNVSVTVGAASLAGGLAASGDIASTFTNTSAIGAVSGGGNSILGGLIGVTNIGATVTNSTTAASSTVTSTGANSWVGGFVGGNGGTIISSQAFGAVNGTSDSLIGGFAALNFGLIQNSHATNAAATVAVSGANNYVGGFVGMNFGSIDPSTSAGNVTGGAGNILGSFAGANGTLANIPGGLLPGSSFPQGTISVGSVGSGTVNGGTGAQVGTSSPTMLPALPSVINSCDSGLLCAILKGGLTLALLLEDHIPDVDPLPITQIEDLIKQDDAKTGDPVFTPVQTTNSTGSPAAGGTPGATPGKSSFTPPPLPARTVTGPNGETRSFMPPAGETRLVSDRLILQFGNLSPADIANLAQSLGLQILASQPVMGRILYTVSLPSGGNLRDVIKTLDNNPNVSAAPIYKFTVTQADPAIGKGDPGQYMLGQLRLDKAHALASGKGVTIAVIDSEVDKRHAELQGAISEELDTLDVKEPPHSHGTAMAGAIVSRNRLLGVAPGAKILAVRAFSESNKTAEGTTISILKGIEWSLSQGARVINMSFAGPRDPSLERALKAAHDKGVVLVAAAGNAGPKSPPLYPAADPSVIAVTATDDRNRLFRGANQGPQVSVAAPGVDILAAAPDETYQMSTGTSIATAHVSGVAALMLELDPTLKPDEVRRILESTATDLGPKGKDNQFGWGLVNPQKALEAVATQIKTGDASSKTR